MIDYLMSKYGEHIQANSTQTIAFINWQKEAEKIKEYSEYTGFFLSNIYIKKSTRMSDTYKLRSDKYRVLSRKAMGVPGSYLFYEDLILYKDDFIEDVQVFKQSINDSGINLPVVNTSPAQTLKARVATKRYEDYLQYAFHEEKPPSHEITFIGTPSIDAGDNLRWGSRNFEVLGTENINEKGLFLKVNVLEVLTKKPEQL